MQLGDGTIVTQETPSTAVLTSVAAIAVGGAQTCALTTSGGVRCWGLNENGQVSTGNACVLTVTAYYCILLRIEL